MQQMLPATEFPQVTLDLGPPTVSEAELEEWLAGNINDAWQVAKRTLARRAPRAARSGAPLRAGDGARARVSKLEGEGGLRVVVVVASASALRASDA